MGKAKLMAFGCLQTLQREDRMVNNLCHRKLGSIQSARVLMRSLSGSWAKGWGRLSGGSLVCFSPPGVDMTAEPVCS